MTEEQIKVYGATTCPDTIRARAFFEEHNVAYEWLDVDLDERAFAYMLEVNGHRATPTIRFPDGSTLVEPTNDDLAQKLGL